MSRPSYLLAASLLFFGIPCIYAQDVVPRSERPGDERKSESERKAVAAEQGQERPEARRGDESQPMGRGNRPDAPPRDRSPMRPVAPEDFKRPPNGEFRRQPDAPPVPRTGVPSPDAPFGLPPISPGVNPPGLIDRPSFVPEPGSVPGRDVGSQSAGLPPHYRVPDMAADSWERLQRLDPELYRLYLADFEYERLTQALAAQIREAAPKDRENWLVELRDLVAEHFEIRQQRRRLQLKRFEEEMARTRETVERREAAKQELIDRRVNELTSEQPLIDF